MAKGYCLFIIIISLIYSTHGALNLRFEHVSTVYLPYNVTDEANPQFGVKSGSVEQMAYHEEDQLIYVVGSEVLHVVNYTDLQRLTRITTINVGPYKLTDIEVCGDYLFITGVDKLDNGIGKLFVYNKYSKSDSGSLKLIHSLQVGAIPDMLQVIDNCKTVIIAVEGEPYSNTNGSATDPPGGVGIVHFNNFDASSQPSFKFLDFGMFYNSYDLLKSRGVKLSPKTGVNAFSTNEFEPEYIAIDHEKNTAFVVLQESNAVAEVDLVSESIKDIYGLGSKQFGYLDGTDDGAIGISFWPIKSFYQPDGIKYYKWNGRRLLFTANEGAQTNDALKGKDLSGAKFGPEVPDFLISAIKDSKKIGNLMFSKNEGLDSNGVYQALYTFGGRSFSIWDTEQKFERLYDSGSDIEEKTALFCPHVFNSDGTRVDIRSEKQGPQPECVIVGEIESRLYIFVSNKRPGTIIVYSIGDDVTKPRFETIFCDGLPKNNRSLEEKFQDKQLYMMVPEDIRFLSKVKSIAEFPYLLVSGSTSSSVSILKLDYTTEIKEDSTSGAVATTFQVHTMIPAIFIIALCYILIRNRLV